MAKYFLKRILYIFIVFLILSMLMFLIYKLTPGDPVDAALADVVSTLTKEEYKALYDKTKIELGLDQNLVVQYGKWFGRMLQGDFGYSIQHKMDVSELIKSPMRSTISLNLVVLFFVFIITIPLGILTAVKKGTLMDKSVRVVSIFGYSLPMFLIALLFILAFAIIIPIFPIGGMNSPGFRGTGIEKFFDTLWHMVLPVTVMTAASVGSITRYVRAAMINVLSMDYIRTARAKGVKEKVVVYSHAFRNALIPFVTILTGWFIGIFGGSIVIENIFLRDGIGTILIGGLRQRDYNVVLAMQMFYVILALTGNLIMDIGYMLVDPRVKLA